MYKFAETDYQTKYEGRYWNCQGKGIAIIASVTECIDWAAYIGCDDSRTEQETLEYVAFWGCKLSREDAEYFFPNIKLPYRS